MESRRPPQKVNEFVRQTEAERDEKIAKARAAEIEALKARTVDAIADTDGFVAIVKALNHFENILRRLSDIEGGLRSLDPNEDKPSVRRIRTAAREIQADIESISNEIVDMIGLLAVEPVAAKAFIQDLSTKLRAQFGRRKK